MDASAEEKIQLLSKILDTEATVAMQEAEDWKNQLYEKVHEKLVPELNKSSLSGIGEHVQDLEDCFEELDVLLMLPELSGNHAIGIVNFAGKAMAEWLSPVLSGYVCAVMFQDTEIPMVLTSDGERTLKAINDCQHRMELSPEEYAILRNLWKDDVSIANVLTYYCFVSDERWKNTVLSYFPPFSKWKEAHVQRLLSFQDEIFVLLKDVEDARDYGEKVICTYQDLAPLCIVTSADKVADFQEAYQHENVTILTPEQMAAHLMQVHQKHDLRFMETRMQWIFAELDARYADAVQEQQEILQSLKIDLSAESGSPEVAGVLKKEQKEFAAKLRASKEERQHLRLLRPEIMEGARAVDQSIQPKMKSSLVMNLSSRRSAYRAIWIYLLNGSFEDAESELLKLRHSRDPYAYIFQLLFDWARGRRLDERQLQKLREENENAFVRKAKIVLGKELGFSDLDLQLIAKDMDSKMYDSGEEYYYRGLWHMTRSEREAAVKCWKRAYRYGNHEAASSLLEIASKMDDEKLLDWLANHMDPEANYQAGLREEKTHSYSAGWRYRVAAAQGYLPAVRKVMMQHFWKVYGVYKKAGYPKGRLDEKLATDVALEQGLCEFLLEKDPDNHENAIVKEKLGSLYAWKGDDRKALHFLSQSGTAEAKYQCGKIYQYEGGDVPQNLSLSKKYFQEAARMGHEKASREAEKVNGWMKDQRRMEGAKAQRYSKSKDYATKTTSTRKEDDGFCIITTAACHVLHKGDDCNELNTLRRFRDMASDENHIIRDLVKEYYRVAPLLLDKINVLPEKEEIYQHLWEDYIEKSYLSIRNHDHLEATKIYIQMVVRLCNKYDVVLAEGIQEKIKTLLQNPRKWHT